jgi:hypothetical protein
MSKDNQEWLPLDKAATHFGYSHPESLRQRIRQLRRRGHVVDLGRPPGYRVGNSIPEQTVVIMWPNPKTALLSTDSPADFLNPKRGKRARERK